MIQKQLYDQKKMAALQNNTSREDECTPVLGDPGTSTDVFDYESSRQQDYKSPIDYTRLKAKPWKNVTHGRYKDIFNLQALSPRDGKGTRPMRMSPDLDYKVDIRDNKKGEHMPLTAEQIEKQSTKIARDELKKVIQKQRITLEKNTRLYKEMRNKGRTDSFNSKPPISSI